MYRLTLKGSPRDRGRIHGETFRTQIHELSAIRRGLLRRYLRSMPDLEVEELAFKQVQVFAKHLDLYEEFCGISEASGLGLCDLMILNNYTDLRDFAYEKDQREEGCSTFAWYKGGSKLVGQTWDMHASATPYMLHLTEEASTGPDGDTPRMEILTVVGCLALAGVNDQGVCVFVNNLNCWDTSVGMPWPPLVRGMLEKSSAQLAQKYLEKNIPSSGHNYLICDPSEAINIETTGKRSIVSARTSNDVIYHTNHYTSELKATEVKAARSLTTDKRYREVGQFFEKFKPAKDELAVAKLSEELFKNQTLCIPPTADPHGSATCGGIVLNLDRKEGILFKGLYSKGDLSAVAWS